MKKHPHELPLTLCFELQVPIYAVSATKRSSADDVLMSHVMSGITAGMRTCKA